MFLSHASSLSKIKKKEERKKENAIFWHYQGGGHECNYTCWIWQYPADELSGSPLISSIGSKQPSDINPKSNTECQPYKALPSGSILKQPNPPILSDIFRKRIGKSKVNSVSSWGTLIWVEIRGPHN